ncbi:MAG TPA: HD-GYP domain-containing protein [Clostridiaceae bacterium]
MKKLQMNIRIYLLSIYFITVSLLFLSIKFNYISFDYGKLEEIVFFSIIVAITESFSYLYKSMSFTTTFAIQLAAYIIFDPFITIIISILGFSLRVLKVNGKYKHLFNTPFYGTLFNHCIIILSLISGNFFCNLLGANAKMSYDFFGLVRIFIFSSVYFITNTLIITSLYSLMTKKSFIYSFLNNARLMFITIFIMAPFGILLSLIYKGQYKYLMIILVLFPIMLARYTFSLYTQSQSKYVQTVDVLMHAMEARDKYTEGHTKRVGELSILIATELKYNQWKKDELYMAALLHDVGKIGIDDAILNKPGKLTEEEYEIIKSHPVIGYNILKDIDGMDKINFIVKHHHERYDGKGYPDNCKPDELNMEIFIIQLADSVDAMATDRPYRKTLTDERILQEVIDNRGTQFHPEVVDAYLRYLKKLGKYSGGE